MKTKLVVGRYAGRWIDVGRPLEASGGVGRIQEDQGKGRTVRY